MGRPAIPLEQRFFKYVSKDADGCWRWTGKRGRYGFVRTGTMVGGDRRTELAHRVSWKMNFGPIPDGMLVCHTCDNGHCVNPAHLFLGSPQDNVRDMMKKKRGIVGSLNPRAKLTDSDVALIRASSLPAKALAASYGVAVTTIFRAKKREAF